MKKSLIALAVLAASGVAMAQSSVTLYGVADLSLAKTNAPSRDDATRTAFQMSGNGTANNGNSRLGVRGVEDLGGGLKASFNFEQGLNAENGKTDANTWQRNAWMALQGNFGRVQMGRTLHPSFYGMATWELTGAANYSAVGNQFSNTIVGFRNDSVLQYTTPTVGGFDATLGYINKPDNVLVGGNALGNAKYDLNVRYVNGPLAAALTYNKVNGSNAAGQGYKGNLSLGAKYDFGSFVVAGSIQDAGAVNVAGFGVVNSKGFTIGATVPLGAFSVTLDIARENGTGMKNTDVLLEGKYALSKRTFAYAAYYKDGFSAAGLGMNGTGYNTGAKSHLGLGIRHNF